jgi:hypothetical protein
MILILTSVNDAHADEVVAILRDRGATFMRFDPACFPREATISLSYSSTGATRWALRTGDHDVDLDQIRTLWYRRPGVPTAQSSITDTRAKDMVELECKQLLDNLWLSLDRSQWIPGPPHVIRAAGMKARQLKLAGALGFCMPPTLVTNDPKELLQFFKQHAGHIVSKPLGVGFGKTMIDEYVRYTDMVTTRDIAHASSLRLCPMIFQAYVPKRVELRITVVGTRVFAAEIDSQASHHTRFDWRRYDQHETEHRAHSLPPELTARCVELTRALGLSYGAIDMILTPDDRYVFLEINPNGQYAWIEDATGFPIHESICDLLMQDDAMSLRAVS